MSVATRIAAAVLLMAVIVAGCGDTSMDEGELRVPNPASEHCVEQGGRLDIREDDEGSQYGVCLFDDGSECEEWALYRGECEPGSGHP